MAIHPPGSHAAVRIGCKCDMLSNQLGRGVDSYTRVFIVADNCELHQRDFDYSMPPSAMTESERRSLRQKAIIRVENSIERIRRRTANDY